MRAVLERAVPAATALAGSAERIPLDDASVDGAFAAQAFHWFEKAAALPEIARVLRANGIFAVVWNGPDESRPDPRPADFVAEVRALRDAVPHPWKEEPEWEELLEQSGLFAEVHRRTTVPHDHVLDRAAMLDNLRSVSWIAHRATEDAAAFASHAARAGSCRPRTCVGRSAPSPTGRALSELASASGVLPRRTTASGRRTPEAARPLPGGARARRDARVLDLGAGTGRLTRELERRFADVVAVEPDERCAPSTASALAGTAEAIPLRTQASTRSSPGRHSTGSTSGRDRRDRAGAPAARGARDHLHALVGDGAAAARARLWSRCASRRSDSRDQRNAAVGRRLPGSRFEPLRKERDEEAIGSRRRRAARALLDHQLPRCDRSRERDGLFARVRPFLAGPYRLPLKHELTWTRVGTELIRSGPVGRT